MDENRLRGAAFRDRLLRYVAANRERVQTVKAMMWLAHANPKRYRCRWGDSLVTGVPMVIFQTVPMNRPPFALDESASVTSLVRFASVP